ncbi:hypothetical protein BV912_01670 [Neisseria dumasiana]|uniref:Uncharacterized protein n=1 Tax=Neisseria dumasiana TaxID=1931275 RepID=A0A1X3DKX7_9NEIS|nr:hypothetical protein BV912_01670 [Neisseria dumasiana]
MLSGMLPCLFRRCGFYIVRLFICFMRRCSAFQRLHLGVLTKGGMPSEKFFQTAYRQYVIF